MSVFDDMPVFIAVFEKGSFSHAGRSLRMSPALVSSRIARLENHLGTRLFVRTTRKVTATDAGRRYYEDCLDIMRRVEEAESRIAEDDSAPKGVLRLTAASALGDQFVTNMIPDFSARYPDIRLQYRMTDALVDVLTDGMDIALRVGPLVDSSLKARVLCPSPRYIFASPDYLAKHGIPKKPHNLVDHNCLMLRFPGSRQYRWRFMDKRGSYEMQFAGTLDSNSGAVLTEWALAGAGLVLKPYWEVAEHVKAGRLKAVLTEHMTDDSYIAALYPYDTFVPPRLRVFLDYLVERVKAEPLFQESLPENAVA